MASSRTVTEILASKNVRAVRAPGEFNATRLLWIAVKPDRIASYRCNSPCSVSNPWKRSPEKIKATAAESRRKTRLKVGPSETFRTLSRPHKTRTNRFFSLNFTPGILEDLNNSWKNTSFLQFLKLSRSSVQNFARTGALSRCITQLSNDSPKKDCMTQRACRRAEERPATREPAYPTARDAWPRRFTQRPRPATPRRSGSAPSAGESIDRRPTAVYGAL